MIKLTTLPVVLNFWASPHHTMDPVYNWGEFRWSRRGLISLLENLTPEPHPDPGYPRDVPPENPVRSVPPIPTDVPTPEPHDPVVPEPIDVPAPEPGEVPSEGKPKENGADPQPRPVP